MKDPGIRISAGYGVGYLGIALVTQVVMTWVLFFYAPPEGRGLQTWLPAASVGIAMAIGRIVDALADPLVGAWSDAVRTRWGRRLPFIVLGTPPLTAAFMLLWRPPVAGPSLANFVYLALVLSAFFFFFTVVVAPYLALLPELARPGKARVGLATWQAWFNIAGLVIAMLGSAMLIERFGFATMGLLLGLIAAISLLLPALVVREPRIVSEEPLPLVTAIRSTLQNGPFRSYVVGQLLFWFGFNIVMTTSPYLVTILMGLEEGMVGLALATSLLVSMVSFPIIGILARRYGKKNTLIFTSGWLAVVLVSLSAIGRWPVPISAPVQGFITIAAVGLPLAGLFILPNAIVADITDLDAERTGRRREAIYYGVQGLLVKGGMGLSSVAAGFLLQTYGSSSADPLGILLAGPSSAVFVVAGILVFRRFPLKG